MSRLDDIRINSDDIEPSTMDQVEDWCMDADNEGSHYPGMTYEQGVMAALDWLSGDAEDPRS